MVDSVPVHFKNARVEKMPLNIRIKWNVGTACVSECVLKTLACRGLRVGVCVSAPLSFVSALHRVFQDVGPAPSAAWRDLPSLPPPLRPRTPPPRQPRPPRKKSQGRGRGRVGREGLWLERVLQCNAGEGAPSSFQFWWFL